METKFSKSTDTEHKIKLESRLLYASWRQGVAPAGGEVAFEVLTSFVGNGAPIKVRGTSESGARLGKVSGKMRNNKFIGKLAIPDDAEIGDEVYFEVKLSKNGLSGESNRIGVVPAVVVSNMKWSASEARRGDILKLTADVKGCQSGTEAKVTIYEYDRDNIHDKIVELPTEIQDNKIDISWEYEYHEDTDEIPTDEELQTYGKSYNPPEYFFVIDINGQRFGKEQESGLLLFKDYIDEQFSDELGVPLSNADYFLVLADGTEHEGTLDDEGRLFMEDVPPGRYMIYVLEQADEEDEEDEEEEDEEEEEERIQP